MATRNLRLIRAREDLGWHQAEAARRMEVDQTTLCGLETRRVDPVDHNPWSEDCWTPTAQRIADFYGISPVLLWPEEAREMRTQALQLEMSEAQVTDPLRDIDDRKRLEAIASEFAKLEPRAQAVLTGRVVDERTYLDLATEHGISKERVRQIEDRSLEKLTYTLAVHVWRRKWGRDVLKKGSKPLYLLTNL